MFILSILFDEVSDVEYYYDGAIKGIVQIENQKIKKLFLEHALQGNCIGFKLLTLAIENHIVSVNSVWKSCGCVSAL